MHAEILAGERKQAGSGGGVLRHSTRPRAKVHGRGWVTIISRRRGADGAVRGVRARPVARVRQPAARDRVCAGAGAPLREGAAHPWRLLVPERQLLHGFRLLAVFLGVAFAYARASGPSGLCSLVWMRVPGERWGLFVAGSWTRVMSHEPCSAEDTQPVDLNPTPPPPKRLHPNPTPNQPAQRDQIAVSRPLICAGARRNPAACVTNQSG